MSTLRSVPEWIGDTPDQAVPDRVRVRVFDAKKGRCHACTRKIMAGETWTCEHVIALVNWRETDEQPHGNRESNLDVTCCNCLPEKNSADVAEKSAVYQTRKRHLGVKTQKPWRPLPGTKRSGLRKRMDGSVERR